MNDQEKLEVCDDMLRFILRALAEIESGPTLHAWREVWLGKIDETAREALQVLSEGDDE